MKKVLKISTLGEYVSLVNDIQNKWINDTEFIYPWFRGQANSNHQLLPGLYRPENTFRDEFLYRNEFMKKAIPFVSDSAFVTPSSKWEWYFLMQHYGLPTRLLDWTEGSLIALHFAIFNKNARTKYDPCVWVLNPFEMNGNLHNKYEIFSFDHYDIENNYLNDMYGAKMEAEKPVAVEPKYNSKRIVVQRGTFTIHGNDQTPLEQLPNCDKFLFKIYISRKQLDNLKIELFMSGVTESSIFPELNGLSRELKAYWQLEKLFYM